MLKTQLLERLKYAYRLLRYQNQRKKFTRELRIRALQNKAIAANYAADSKNLIVFLVPGADWYTGADSISGGVMSIVSICEETSKLGTIHNAQTIMCTFPKDHLLWKHSMFENNTTVYRFSQLPRKFQHLSKIVIHIPEFLVIHFFNSLTERERVFLKGISEVHINILNQNIRLMPPQNIIDEFKARVSRLTMTTAHQKYCTQLLRQQYGCPLHKLSVWISPEQYIYRQWADKENLLVVSPDFHPQKERILKQLEAFEGLQVRIIQNLSYQEYKKLIACAKWSLTFGEGLDGYFIEPVFSGAISFAVYNLEFFTSDFAELPTVYETMDKLAACISKDIRKLNNRESFSKLQKQQYTLCEKYYSWRTYQENIERFYQGKYTYA